jgi:3-dehydro-L-gulonate 2-dehydrogenase
MFQGDGSTSMIMNDKTEYDKLMVEASRMQEVFYGILLKHRLPESKAKICAEVFTANSLDGVYTHGVNRFPKFVKLIQKGVIKIDNGASCISKANAIEQWNGNAGIGITNALTCTHRAIELASEFGMGCIALSNTNHWMRAGTYARYAALRGYAFIAWSNTIRNTPAWGATDPRLGNNPLTIGIPFNEDAIVLDMAMSQFSYGTLEKYKMAGESLPVPGGYDEDGKLSTDPSSILKTRRTLPIGYWKGSGLSLVLDILAAILSSGLSVSQISKQEDETNLSQIFIAFNLKSLRNYTSVNTVLQQIIADFKDSTPENESSKVRYPGEGVMAARQLNSVKGIPVFKNVWNEIEALLR